MTLFVYRAYVDIATQEGVYFGSKGYISSITETLTKSILQCWCSCKKRILVKTLSLLFQAWEPGTKKTAWIIYFLGFFQRTLPTENFIVRLHLQKWVDTLWLFKSITLQYWELTEWDCVHRIDWCLAALHPSFVTYVNQVSHLRMIRLYNKTYQWQNVQWQHHSRPN